MEMKSNSHKLCDALLLLLVLASRGHETMLRVGMTLITAVKFAQDDTGSAATRGALYGNLGGFFLGFMNPQTSFALFSIAFFLRSTVLMKFSERIIWPLKVSFQFPFPAREPSSEWNPFWIFDECEWLSFLDG